MKRCQQHHRHGVCPGVNVIWTRLPAHLSGDLGGGPIQGSSPGVKNQCDQCLPLWHATARPDGRLCIPHSIGVIICINLVLPIGWVDSPKFFCAFLEALMEVNALIHAVLPEPGYGVIAKTPYTGMGKPHTLDSLTLIKCHMDALVTAVQGWPGWKCPVFDGTIRSLKLIFLSFPGKMKELVSVKKLWAEVGNWTHIKEVLGWKIYIESCKVTIPEQKLQEILQLISIMDTQRRIGWKNIEHLIDKLCSMNLMGTRAVAHFYHIHHAFP